MEEQYRVWAPNAGFVEIEFDGRRHRMTPDEDGWWVHDPAPEDRFAHYSFRLDGGPALPDPRSERQPLGVHGPSQRVDHAAFEWTDDDWSPPPFDRAVLYEIHVGTFTESGTFDAAVDRLDHLVDLGVTHVEVMPVNAFPGSRGWGYDGVGWYATHETYGGPEAFKRFVDACHARGLAVVLDVVYNHLGPDGNYLPQFGPYITDRYGTPWGGALNYDGPHSPEVRRYCIDNALMWLRDYHVDGLRLDAVQAIFDNSALRLVEEMARDARELSDQLGRPLTLIAESMSNDPWLVRSPDEHGAGLAATWNDDFHHALHALLTGERDGYYADFGTMEHLATALREGWVLSGQYSLYRRRNHGRPPTGLTGTQLVSYLQNHDQTGNRALGERFAHLVGHARQKIGAAVTLLSANIPMLFMGEEWAASSPFQFFTDHSAEGLGDAVREGRRREFARFDWTPDTIPDPQAKSTFDDSTLDWSEREEEPHADMLGWYRDLLTLRQEHSELHDGRLDGIEVDYDETEGWFQFRRGSFCVVFSLAREENRSVDVDGTPSVVLASDDGVRVTDGTVELPPNSIAVLRTS